MYSNEYQNKYIYILQKGKPTPYTTSTNYLNYYHLLLNHTTKITTTKEIIMEQLVLFQVYHHYLRHCILKILQLL